MELYHNYREFLEELIVWGDQVGIGQPPSDPSGSGQASSGQAGIGQSPSDPAQSLLLLLEKAERSAQQDVFSPFLYLALSARLEREELLLLAAALYAGLEGRLLTPALWELFWGGEEEPAAALEVFYRPDPVLYEYRSGAGEDYLEMDPCIFLFLRGMLPERQRIPGMDWYSDPREPLPPLGESIRLYEKIDACLSDVRGRKLVYLQGEEGSGRKLNYAYFAALSGMALAVIRYDKLQSEQQLRNMQRECLLHHAMFVVELPEQEEDLLPLICWLEREESIFLLGTAQDIPGGTSFGRQYLPFSVSSGQVLGDRELFEQLTAAYPWESGDLRTDFLNRYNFLPGRMRRILELAEAYARSRGSGAITGEVLRDAILGVSSHSLGQYAKKIRCLYRMDDLILPDAPKQKLAHMINRVRNRKMVYETWGFLEKSAYGNGTAMIFAGPPGTGKTMAAQVMAAELGMELYRIELPAIVDKYIGETEKKLNRIFSEAEKSMAVLFFDEADVLFSKRTEIKESNDKYSNMEIAFLLQKMEEYEGVSILATNYLQNFDNAFRRRVSDIINFPLPDAGLRLQMWQTMIPSRLPVSEDIDYGFLAGQFEISGSMIKNALLSASFLAAESAGAQLSMEHILKGLSHELEKSGKKLSRDEYGEYGHLYEYLL